MELDKEHLKEKALLLLRRERELFELRMKHEKVLLWLKLTQMFPVLFAERHLGIDDAYARLRKTLIEGLRLQRVSILEIGGDTLRAILPAGLPRPLPPSALSLVQAESAGFGNDPTDPAGAALAEALGLARFIWSRIDLPDRASVVVAAGFDRTKAKFQPLFEASDAVYLRNATQHVQGLLGNSLLVHELKQERDSLQRRDRELQEATDELRASNETLEHRVRDRTEELGRRNRDMRLVLDNVAQALLTIDFGGRLSAERSAKVDEWFGAFDGNPKFVDYIGPIDREFADRFELGHEALNEQVLPAALCLAQLPTRLRAGEKIFDCTYFPLPEAAGGSGLLIVVDDVTEQVRVAQEESEQRELLAVFQALTRDREGFLASFQESNRLVEELAGGGLDETTRDRHLHTLKGNAAMAGATVVAGLCHRAEDAAAVDGPGGAEAVVKQLQQRWAAIGRTLETVVGDRATATVEIPARALDQICDDIGGGASLAEVAHRLNLFRLEPVDRPLGRLAHYARALAQRSGKGELSVVLDAADVRVDPRSLGALWSNLIHLVRNAIDHGIEPCEERLARGKSADARLFLRAFRTPDELAIELEDDGRGIDWTAVRQRARSRGMPCETEDDLVRAILSDGFSTKSTVTMMSGRGVGMAAVQQQVLRLGGTLSVLSEAGQGTRWRITVPLSKALGAAVDSGDRPPVGRRNSSPAFTR